MTVPAIIIYSLILIALFAGAVHIVQQWKKLKQLRAASTDIPNILSTLEEQVKTYEATINWLRARRAEDLTAYKRLEQHTSLWQGKWAIVKHENNKLRSQLYRRGKKQLTKAGAELLEVTEHASLPAANTLS